jgi:translation initiation factor 1
VSNGRLVYSTDSGSQKKETKSKTHTPAAGPTKMRLETKGRGGRAVTVLWNMPFNEADIKSLMKDVQAKKACGATFKDGRIEFQGDIREAITAYFTEKSLKLVPAGG